MSDKRLTQSMFYNNRFNGRFNEFTSIDTYEKLVEYTDCEPCDWVKKATGPNRFWGLRKEEYENTKKIIDEGKVVSFIHVERDYDDVSAFDEAVVKIGCNVLSKEYD
jgi:hypothetical protein